MGIKIVTQTNEQECGVCALTALHNYFYSEQISKEQALDASLIQENGMTIFDLETLGNKLGLECESYELKFAEFLNLKINNYFILLLSTSGANHYVVARKRKHYVEIYDSCSLQMNKTTFDDLKNVFLNVLILVKKQPNKFFAKTFGKQTTLLMLDLRFVLINLFLSITIMSVAILSATFLNWVIDLAIGKGSINNLLTICFIFVLFYFLNDLLNYVSNLYMTKHVKTYLILFTSKILTNLERKNLDFFKKIDKNWIFKIDECVYTIANFSVVEINKFIVNIIFVFVCTCIIGSIQYYLLIFVLVYAIIEAVFFLFSYRKKKEVFMSVIRSENTNSQYYKQLITFLSNEVWMTKRKNLIAHIKTNYSNIYKNYSDVILFKSNTQIFKSILKSFCEISVIGLMSYFIIKNNKLTIGQLTFVISAFSLYKNATSDLFNYFLMKLEFDVYWQVYKDLTIVSNVNSSQTFILKEEIKNISFNVDNKVFELETKNVCNCVSVPIISLFKQQKNICINHKPITFNKEFSDQIIIVDQYSRPDSQIVMNQIESNLELYSQYLRYFALDLNGQQYSFYDSIIINFLSLLSEKNKIIFIDDVIKYIEQKDRLIIKQIINKIKQKNTVFIVGDGKND